MAIVIKRNKYTARVIRQIYVRKNSEGNPEGFLRLESLGQIRLDATEVPKDLAKLLTEAELNRLVSVIVEPARFAKEQAKKLELERQHDPVWRIQQAIALLDEASRLGKGSLPSELAEQLQASIAGLDFKQPFGVKGGPLAIVTQAVRLAKVAIKKGHYGEAPSGAVSKNSPAAKEWAELRNEVVGTKDSLMTNLQKAGWVFKRGS